jgi:glycosyltransferase involved in cell wall biosynthesis
MISDNHPNKSNGHITVALSAYNREDTIEKAVRTILGQTYKNLTLYVVDDASTDQTVDIVKKMLSEDSRLQLIALKENGGTYSAKNRILRDHCHGEFYAHQDADDFSWDTRFEKQLEFLKDHPQVAGCGTGIDEFFVDPTISPTIESEFPIKFDDKTQEYHRKVLYRPLLKQYDFVSEYVESSNLPLITMNGSIVVRTEVIKSLGGFDGRTPIGADYEFFLRLLTLHDFGNLQEVLYSRKYHAESLTRRPDMGRGSSLRKQYEGQWHERFKSLMPLMKSEDTTALKTVLKQDMFVAECDFEWMNEA